MTNQHPFPSKTNSLSRLGVLGYCPSVILDVGVNNGTEELIRLYPESHHILFEPIPLYNQAISSAYQYTSYELHNIAISDKDGVSAIQTYAVDEGPTATHSLILPSTDGVEELISPNWEVNGGANQLFTCKTYSMETFISENSEKLASDILPLLKIDVDSVEVQIMRGIGKASKVLGCIVVECRTPFLAEMLAIAATYDFYLWEICDLCYLDDKLSQFDLVFLRHDLNDIIGEHFKNPSGSSIWERYFELSSTDPNTWANRKSFKAEPGNQVVQ